MKYSTVIVAAGKGTRANLGYNKIFYEIKGETVISKTISTFDNDIDCEEIIMVISLDDRAMFEQVLSSKKIVYIEGGSTRQESVFKGLEIVKSDYVMIHDGARPYIDKKEIAKLKRTLQEDDACLLAVPVVDTIKIVKDGYVEYSPERSTCYAAQTPQCFKTDLIIECHKKATADGFVASDDAQLVETYGGNIRVKLVPGDYANKKITTKEDLI